MSHYPFEEKNFLGNRLRELRLAFGFKQDDIARALNVSRSTYSYYETSTTRPDPAVLGKLAHYYNIPIESFYEEEPVVRVSLRDPDGRRRRTSRTSMDDPQRVAELQPMERSLILFLRANPEYSAGSLLERLEDDLIERKKAGK